MDTERQQLSKSTKKWKSDLRWASIFPYVYSFRICILQHPDLSRPLASRRELGHKEAEPQLFQSLDPNGQESCANGKIRGNNKKENKENNKKLEFKEKKKSMPVEVELKELPWI